MSRALHLGALACIGAAAFACGKKGASTTASSPLDEVVVEQPPPPMDPIETEAWKHATEGAEEDAMRLANLVGCTGLRERAEVRAYRVVAIRAMSYCDDFSELPWLVEVAATANDAEATEALEAITEEAARPRRAVDPEDARELGDGCRALLELSRSSSQPRARRVAAVRALRMLSERGCVKRSEIPTELDAKG